MKILSILLSLILSTQVLASSKKSQQQSLTIHEVLNVRSGKVLIGDKVEASVVTQVLQDTPLTQAHVTFAKDIGHSILNNPNRRTFDQLMQNVMSDHSKSNHKHNGSYFDTDDEQQIRNIIKEIVANPDNYIYQNNQNNNCTYKLIKNFNQQDCQKLIGQNHIGIDRKQGRNTQRAIVCVGTRSPISKKENSLHWNGGSVMTAFPEQ
ncbi:MAG: hypothetical protein H0U27_05785 [Nitrosopumilus sp.]|nr:hypothetical protein [Nitrosopumilus sp.]MBA3284555.1 hypothetical protein [Nitrosopumilus sp.]